MADDSQFATDTTPTLQQLVDYFVDSLHDAKRIKQWETAIRNAVSKGMTVSNAVERTVIDGVLEIVGKVFFNIEEHIEKVAGPPLARIAGKLIGRDLSIDELRRAANASGENVVGSIMAKIAMDAMTPRGDTIEPSADGAQRFLGVLSQLVFSGWFEATAFELITTAIPDMDSFESVAQLPRELVDALGLGRLARRALSPL